MFYAMQDPFTFCPRQNPACKPCAVLTLYVFALVPTEDLAPCCQRMNVFILFAPGPVSKAPSIWVNQMIP